tara:strand:+ start:165 stop:524 length:360 start_codon:yes stop_codon:yes gene_type:complete
MTWKDILKQREYDLIVSDPKLGSSVRSNEVIFESNAGKFEFSENGNEYFDGFMEDAPNSPLIAFFKKFNDSNKQFTEQEIESSAKSMGLEITKDYDEEDDPEEYQQWIAENQFYEQQRR